MNIENTITTIKNVLVICSEIKEHLEELNILVNQFCGTVTKDTSILNTPITNKTVYVCGDISIINNIHQSVLIIKELSFNYENCDNAYFEFVTLGQVPIIVHNAGVYFRQLFTAPDLFNNIKSEHKFQELTESNKASKALRKGIYLTEVKKELTITAQEALHFHLLRCSSNLTGATENFRGTDQYIITSLNKAASQTFELDTTLNHVLAQIYENKKVETSKNKEVKAKISAHSDKTKDMPKEGLIAFCTFYDNDNFEKLSPSKTDSFDWCYKKSSALTRLHFKLKPSVEDKSLVSQFSVTLYPNSVFIIPLSTNRLYTHEIKPSVLGVDQIPTRMGYVARCSNLEAVYVDEQTFIKEEDQLIPLQPINEATMQQLRDSYYEENKTINKVDYGKVEFSMNSGDYKKPIY